MFETFAAWAGWKTLKASARWLLPLAVVVAAVAALWIAVILPRIQLRRAEIKAQAVELQKTEDALKTVQATVAAQKEVDGEKKSATDDEQAVRTERVEKTTIIREAAAARAEASGDPEVSDGLDAFLADIRKGQTK